MNIIIGNKKTLTQAIIYILIEGRSYVGLENE